MASGRPFAFARPPRISEEVILWLFGGAFILLVGIFLALAGVGAGLTYYVLSRNNTSEAVSPQSYLLSSYFSLGFTDQSKGEHEGWLLLGLRGAPVIILCHGYDSNRSDLLSLGAVLRDNHFNVYLFNFNGPKANEKLSTLGPRQASDLMAAIQTVTRQPDINPTRVGLYGTSVGGYAALAAAEANSKVKALVVDTTYSDPDQMFDSQIDRLIGGSGQALSRSYRNGISPRLNGREWFFDVGQPAQACEGPQAVYFGARQSFFGGDDRGPLRAIARTQTVAGHGAFRNRHRNRG